MAYKDEYEVARLHLDPAEVARRDAEYGPDARTSVLLHPPVLRALGMQRKIKLGGRLAGPGVPRPARGAAACAAPRSTCSAAPASGGSSGASSGEYQARRSGTACDGLGPDTVDRVVEVAGTADLVRGYEEIKLANVGRFRERVAELLTELGAQRAAGSSQVRQRSS